LQEQVASDDARQRTPGRVTFAGLVFDLDARTLTGAGGKDVALTPSEFGLLSVLVRGAGRALSRDHLLQAVAGREAEAFDRSIDVLVGRLRRKIEADPKNPRLIVTVPGVGYRFAERPAPAAAGSPPAGLASGLDRPSLAVLPFANLSGDPEQEYFADGMVEEITTALSRARWFYVIARNSSFTYKGRAVDVKQVGRELGVRYVLEGSVRKAGDRVRITAQLIDTGTARHVWVDRFDGESADIFDLQDRITERVVGAIEPNLQRAEIARAAGKPTESLDAYDLYLRALAQYYTMGRVGTGAAVDLLRQAIRIDGGFALAKATLAFVHVYRDTQGWSDPWDAATAIALAREALANDRDDPATLSLAGHTLSRLAHDHDQTRVALDRAVSLNPHGAQVLNKAGWVYFHCGHPEQAIDFFQRAMRLSPLDSEVGWMLAGLAGAHLMAGRNEQGLAFALRAIEEMPSWAPAYRYVILALVRLGRVSEARMAATRALSLDPSYRIAMLARPFRDQAFMDEYTRALHLAGVPT
jgi:TolB-like protein